MSFDVICNGCGAPSSPSVGICPFCKTVMTSNKHGAEQKTVDVFMQLYNQGETQRALALGTELERQKPDLRSDLMFALTFTKVLLECEAPTSRILGLLTHAHLHNPESPDLGDYMEIVAAKNALRKGASDPGEIALKNILRRSPQNLHAHFILGGHYFWTDELTTPAISHLETCVRIRPNFLRAWGCLGAIYKKIGNPTLSHMAFQKCVQLETDPKMKAFFETQLAQLA